MKNLIRVCLLLAGVVFATTLRADILVLVHGYLSGAESWESSGVMAVLKRAG